MQFFYNFLFMCFLYCKLFIYLVFPKKQKRKPRKYIDRLGDVYYFNAKGQHHRKNGPAIISKHYKMWSINGQIHREDGPAIEWDNGKIEFYLNGVRHTEGEYLRKMSKLGKILYG